MTFADIAVNLTSPSFDNDRDAVIARANAAGVNTIIATGCSLEDSGKTLALIRHYECCFATAGVHPHNATDWNASSASQLVQLIDEDKECGRIVAIGECGLDYNRNFSPPAAQKKCFEDQAALACSTGKPLFLHERDAFDDFLPILKKHRPGLSAAVVHCFTGGERELEAYLALDCYIGITGWICDERRNANLIPLLARIPADRLLLETDAPYLIPRNMPKSAYGKNHRNEPAFLVHIAAFAAEVTGKTQEQLAAQTSENACRLFKLPPRF